ncbi:MAG: 2Fe-2S iron-sulfur cluster binding domain-containing protein [Magnetovibrio sp.]|nr:2Fe-2S iron-sulfur cluster binding domain-containing protein [Magnetovibrio sp.]
MTTLHLFLYILLGILAQITLAALLAGYRHLRSYQHLQKRMAGMGDETPAQPRLKDFIPNVSKTKAAPWDGFRDFKVVRRVFEDFDQNICSFYLQPTDELPLPDFKPGQFLTFSLDVQDIKSGKTETITRCYSLSDGPGYPYYRISVKRALAPQNQPDVPPGVSSNHFHDHVQEGDVLRVRTPSGHFFLAPDTTPIVLVGGGIGITPMLSMLNATLDAGNIRDIWLFYGVSNSSDHALKPYLEELALKHDNLHLHVCYGHPLPDDTVQSDFHHQGYVDVKLLRETLSYQIYNFYVCGPRPMMETLIPALEDWGVPHQHIHYESFGPASIIRKSTQSAPVSPEQDAPAINVTFAKSGETLVWDGSSDTLLDFAEQNGIEISSGCRAGGCGCCQTKIISGEVDYTHMPDFDTEPGTCLMCVARPTQDLTLEG